MVLVLVCLAVMGISFYFLLEYTLSQKRQTVKTNNILELKFALDSAVDYVLFGVKQKYCFSDLLMSDVNCNMNHAGSTERLIMSMEQVNFLTTAGKATLAQAEGLRLAKISRDLEIATVAPSHPLFAVLRALQQQKELADIKFLHVDIERNDSAFLPRSGNEVYLTIKVALTKTRGELTTISVGEEKLQVTSNLVIYPREVGSFALLVPQNLYIGSNDTSPAFGDTHFSATAASKEQYAGKTGLVFLSPVFVNQDIFLNTTAYSPVTFSDRVYLGEGRVMAGAAPYVPATNGGTETRYWRDIDTFGGFLRGLENDGAHDAGLNAFVGKLTGGGGPPSEEMMAKCIDRNLSQADLRKVLTSALSIQLSDANQSRFRYLLRLTNSEFEGQRMSSWLNPQNWGKYSPQLTMDEDFKKIILDSTVKIGGRGLAFSMSKKTTVTSLIEVGSLQYENRLRAAYQAAKAAYEAALADSESSSDEIARLKQEELDALAKLDDYLYKVANPPRITIVTEPIERRRGVSNSRVNFGVTVERANHMLDPNGNLVNPNISLKAYDSGYIDGGFIGHRRDGWRDNGRSFAENPTLTRTLNFTVSANSSTANPATGIPVAIPTDYEDLGDTCMDLREALDSQAFGMADANVSFAKSTRSSWNFAGTGSETGATKTDPLVSSITFDATNALAGQGVTSFQVRSIVGTCTIKGSANFVTGFFACNKLVIEKRTTPLRIIGTFIAGSVLIDPSAYEAGIVWSTIYHAQAVAELRKEGILKRTSNNGNCLSTPNAPIWNPIPSIQDVADRMTCNVISLRAKADPFQWTAVDPDCGMLPGKSNMTCKKRLVRFFVVEQSREGAR